MKTPQANEPVKARIVVVDDHPLLREGVTQFINRQDDLTVCGEGDSIASAKSAVFQNDPDLLLLDLRLGAGDTIDLIKVFRVQCRSMPILVFSQFDETLFAEKAIRAGARGYLMKQEATEEVLNAVWIVLRGGMYVSRQIAVQVFQKSFESPVQTVSEDEMKVEKLSDRELHVFQMLGSGFSTRQIAEDLNLSVKTIESHRENIKNKLDLHSAAELTQAATDWVSRTFNPGSKCDVSTVWKKKK